MCEASERPIITEGHTKLGFSGCLNYCPTNSIKTLKGEHIKGNTDVFQCTLGASKTQRCDGIWLSQILVEMLQKHRHITLVSHPHLSASECTFNRASVM